MTQSSSRLVLVAALAASACTPGPGATPPEPAPRFPPAGITDPALLADPSALRAAFGTAEDNSPLAFSPFAEADPRTKPAKPASGAPLNGICPTVDQAFWVTQTRSSGADIAWAVARSCDAFFEVGYTNKALSNPAAPVTTLPFAGQNDLYVVKRGFDGTAAWAREIGTPGTEFATAVTTQCGSPFVYVAGHSNGSFAGANLGGFDAILLKLAPDGSELWRRQFGSAQNEQVWGAASDFDGNVYLVGQTFGNIPGADTSFPAGTTSAFLAKFDVDGTQLWVQQLGVNNRTTVARGVTTEGHDVFITGYTSASLDDQPFAGGSYDAFVARYDTDGDRVVDETTLIGTPALDQGYSITQTDNDDGDIFPFVTGFTNGTLPGQVNVGANTYDIFVAGLNSDLTTRWLDQVGGSTSVVANVGAVIAPVFRGPRGGVWVAGTTDRTLDGSDQSLGSQDIALLGYSQDGVRVAVDYLGTSGAAAAQGMAAVGGELLVAARVNQSLCGAPPATDGVDAAVFRHSTGCRIESPDPRCKVGVDFGDSHYRTFDGVRFDEEAAGTFVLSSLPDALFSTAFQVHARQCPVPGEPRVSRTRAIGMQIEDDQVEYAATGELYINGVLTPATRASVLPSGGFILPMTLGRLLFAWPDGHRVIARGYPDGYLTATVLATQQLWTSLGGFLGDADDNATSEFAMDRRRFGPFPSRQLDDLGFFDEYRAPGSFTGTWRVQPGVTVATTPDPDLVRHGTDCTDPGVPNHPASAANLTAAQQAQGAALCAPVVDEATRDACVLDVGLTGDPLLATIAKDVDTQLTALGANTSSAVNPTAVYFDDLSSTPGPEWDSIVTNVTPLGDRAMLGTFGNEQVRLTLNNLGAHAQLRVSFDLYVINGWDGDGPFGPNVWRAVADGAVVAESTFSNTFSLQSFPTPGSIAGTGASEVNTLFYPFGDSIYRITLTIPHTASSLALDLSAEGLSGIFAEAWGVGNFEVLGSRQP